MMTLVMMHVTSEAPSKSSCLAEVYAEHYRWLCFALQSDLIFFFFFGKTTCVLLKLLIIPNENYVKAGISYYGGHVVGLGAYDKPTKPATIILASMVLHPVSVQYTSFYC